MLHRPACHLFGENRPAGRESDAKTASGRVLKLAARNAGETYDDVGDEPRASDTRQKFPDARRAVLGEDAAARLRRLTVVAERDILLAIPPRRDVVAEARGVREGHRGDGLAEEGDALPHAPERPRLQPFAGGVYHHGAGETCAREGAR